MPSFSNSFGAPAVLVVRLGVIAFTREFRCGTATSTYLGEPRRTRILVATWLSLALASVVVTVTTFFLASPFSIVLIHSRNGEALVAGQFWQMAAAAFVLMAAFGVIGVALRHQIAAVIGVLVWLLVIEQTATTSFRQLADGCRGERPTP